MTQHYTRMPAGPGLRPPHLLWEPCRAIESRVHVRRHMLLVLYLAAALGATLVLSGP